GAQRPSWPGQISGQIRSLACRGLFSPPPAYATTCACLSRQRVIRASAVVVAHSELWPGTFALQERKRKPLAVGIHAPRVAAVAPAITADTITVKDIKAALTRYVSARGFLRSCRHAGAVRIDGTISVAEARHARENLKQR